MASLFEYGFEKGFKMGCRGGTGTYQRRFDALWGLMATVDAHRAGELSAWRVSEIIGCSNDYAQRLIFERIKHIR